MSKVRRATHAGSWYTNDGEWPIKKGNYSAMITNGTKYCPSSVYSISWFNDHGQPCHKLEYLY